MLSKHDFPIVNRSFGNTFHHQNGPNQIQHLHKQTSQHYKYIPFKISMNFSHPYLKEKIIGCRLGNKEVREVLM